MLMKKLQGKNKQYFDSGDYNMKSGKKTTNPMANPLAAKTVPSIKSAKSVSSNQLSFRYARRRLADSSPTGIADNRQPANSRADGRSPATTRLTSCKFTHYSR